MSELEEERLIYLEPGKKVDYSSLYRHAIKDKIPNALYEYEYNKSLTLADLEKDNSIILQHGHKYIVKCYSHQDLNLNKLLFKD